LGIKLPKVKIFEFTWPLKNFTDHQEIYHERTHERTKESSYFGDSDLVVQSSCRVFTSSLHPDRQRPGRCPSFSEAKTDNLFIEMNTGDFAAFSKDFDRDMLSAVTKDQFDALKKDHDARFSLYLSRQVNSVLKQDDFYVVVYDAKFEKVAAVTVRVVFRIAEPHQISGLWFNK